MACSDCKKYSGYVTERDDGNARRQFVPTNCACSPGLKARERAVITSVLIAPNHKISTTEKTYPHEKTPPKGRQEDEQDRLYQGQMHSLGEGTDPVESCERRAEILRLLPRDVARRIRHCRPSDG